MGGPGFLGFRFDDEWLIVAVWGAGEWFRLDGRLLFDAYWESHDRPAPWSEEGDEVFTSLFVGRCLSKLTIQRDSLTGVLDDGRFLSLAADPADRPLFEANGEFRVVEADEDLRGSGFLAPACEIWIS